MLAHCGINAFFDGTSEISAAEGVNLTGTRISFSIDKNSSRKIFPEKKGLIAQISRCRSIKQTYFQLGGCWLKGVHGQDGLIIR